MTLDGANFLRCVLNMDALSSLGKRITAIENAIKNKDLNLNLVQGYQEVGLLYNQLKSATEGVREDLDGLGARFLQLKAYVESLVLGQIPAEVIAEFDRLALLIKNLFNTQQAVMDDLDYKRLMVAYGESTNKVEQLAGTQYAFLSNTYTSNPKDIMPSGGAFTLYHRGYYKVMLFAQVANDRGDRSRAGIGIYLNGSQVGSAPADAFWEHLTATAIVIVNVQNAPAIISAACSESWHDDSKQFCTKATLLVERIAPPTK